MENKLLLKDILEKEVDITDEIYQRDFEVLELKFDPTKCIGCGKCVEVCAFNAREIFEGKSFLDPYLCRGCGRCVDACPNGAISIVIEDSNFLDKFVARIESLADVEKQ